MNYVEERIEWVRTHIKELENTLPAVISQDKYEARPISDPMGYEIVFNPNTSDAYKKAIIERTGEITLYSPSITEKQVLMAWKHKLDEYVSSLKNMRDEQDNNRKLLEDGVKHLTDNGMPDKEAKELVKFNMELFNRTKDKYNLNLKNYYLFDTESILDDIAGNKPKPHIARGISDPLKSISNPLRRTTFHFEIK